MLIGVSIALVVGLLVYKAFGEWQGIMTAIAVFAIWFAIRQFRRSRHARRNGGDSGSYDGSGSSDSTGHGSSFSSGGGAFGGAGASGFWGFIFDSSHSGDGGGGGDVGGGGNGGHGGGDGGGNGGH